jgi:outer membrane protein assembly factor BamB
MVCLDLESGAVVWDHKSEPDDQAGLIPARTRMSSAIVSGRTSFFVRPLNHPSIFEIDREDGHVLREITGAGALDYRTHPAAILSVDDRYLLYPPGPAEDNDPATGQVNTRIWRHVVCYDLRRGEVAWTFQTGQYFAAPVMDEHTVYVGTAEGYLYALAIEPPAPASNPIGEASPSRIRWSRKLPAAVNGALLVSNGILYAGANDGALHAVSCADGRTLWRTQLAQPDDAAFVQCSRVVPDGEDLFVGDACGTLYRLDRASGAVRERVAQPDWVRAAPALGQSTVVVASFDGTVTCYDRGDRLTERWSRRVSHWHQSCDPVATDGLVLVVSSDMVLHALSFEDGHTVWEQRIVDYPDDYVAFDEFQSSPAVAGSTVFVGTPGHLLAAVDRRDGSLRWRRETGGEVPCDPIVVNDRVYFGQQGGEGRYFCVDAVTGAVVWEQNLGRVWAAANLVDGRLFVPAAEGVAYCLDAETGHILWRYPTGSDLYVCPAVSRGLVYFGSWDEWLYALDVHTGRLVWRFHAETYLDSGAPAVVDETIYLPTMGPRFFALDAMTGAERWRFQPDPVWTTNASPAVSGDYLVACVFRSGGMPWNPYRVETCCLDRHTGQVIWSFPAGGLNAPVIAGDRVYLASSSRGDHGFYCLDLNGNGDGTTTCLFRVELGFTVLEASTAVSGSTAYVYAEDGFLYAIE